MNAETFAEWLHRQGHKVYRTESSYWYDAGPHVLQAFPYHWLITPDKDELHTLMMKNWIIALRYSAPPDYHEGKISYHIVQQNCYNLQMLKKQARNGVKCGLRKFNIEKITFDRLALEGWTLMEETLARQNRSQSMDRLEWERLCRAAENLPGFQVFAATCNDELAGAVIVCRIDDFYTVPYAMSRCHFLRDHVNNALFYSVSCDLLNRENIKGIFFTVQSLDAPEDVDNFKLRMGFESRIVRQNVVFHPCLKPFITPVVYSLSRKLLKHYPSNPQIAKSEGMLRFHLEGRLPVKEQVWPDHLKAQIDLLEENAATGGLR